MRRREFIALLCGAIGPPLLGRADPACAASPTAKRLVGAWRFVSAVSTRDDGTNFDRWGANARGMLTFDRSGQFSQIIVGAESRLFGAKSFFAFGEYTVDEGEQVIVSRIDTSSITRLTGAVQRRKIKSLTDDELVYLNPLSTSGAPVEALWRRARGPNGEDHSAIR